MSKKMGWTVVGGMAVAMLLTFLGFRMSDLPARALRPSPGADQSLNAEPIVEPSMKGSAHVPTPHVRSMGSYSARSHTAAELQITSAAATDRFVLERLVRKFCEAYPTKFSTTREELAQIYGDDPKIGRSADNFDAFRKQFCDRGVTVVEPRYGSDAIEDYALAVRGDSTGELIANAKLLAANGDATDSELDSARQAMAAIVRRTSSRGEFVEAGKALAMPGLGEWDDVRADPGRSGARASAIRDVGTGLAACTIFGGCESGSMLTFEACMPVHCDDGATVQSVARQLLPPDLMAAAEAYAQALIRYRNADGG